MPKSNQLTQPHRNRAGQVVPTERQPFEIDQVGQLGRDRAGQVVSEQVQPYEVDQVSQLARDRAAQVVPGQVQMFEVDQACQLGRDRAGQPFLPEVQLRNLATGIRRYAVPFAERRLGLPIRVVRPTRSARGLVEGRQRRPLGDRYSDRRRRRGPHSIRTRRGDPERRGAAWRHLA